jgi:uncharacterized damage-inducible protein DinB
MNQHPLLDHFRDHLGYVRWADGQAVAAARSVSEAEYVRERPISAGSIHKLLLHMMAAPVAWLTTWRGGDAAGLPDVSAAANPTLGHVAATWTGVHDALAAFLAGLRPDDLARPVRFARDGRTFEIPLGASITHVLDHATYHRGQLNTMVKQGGGTPIRVSYWVYVVNSKSE